MVILGMYVVLWLPYFMSRLLGVVLTRPSMLVTVQILQTAGSMVGIVNFGINVFVYTIVNRDFRRAFNRILHIRQNDVQPIGGTSSNLGE